MDFLNHSEGGIVFYEGFPPFSFSTVEIRKRLREFEEIETSRQKL